MGVALSQGRLHGYPMLEECDCLLYEYSGYSLAGTPDCMCSHPSLVMPHPPRREPEDDE